MPQHNTTKTLYSKAAIAGNDTGNWCNTKPGSKYILIQASNLSGTVTGIILEGRLSADHPPVTINTFTPVAGASDGGLYARFPQMRVRINTGGALTALVESDVLVDEVS